MGELPRFHPRLPNDSVWGCLRLRGLHQHGAMCGKAASYTWDCPCKNGYYEGVIKERGSYTSLMTRAPRDRVGTSQAEHRVSIIPTWTLTPQALSDELTLALERRAKYGCPVVIAMLSSGASFAPDFWRTLKQHGIRAVSVPDQYRDKVGEVGLASAVLHAFEAQERGIGVRKNDARKVARAQEEGAADDLSADDEELLFEQLNAAHSRGD